MRVTGLIAGALFGLLASCASKPTVMDKVSASPVLAMVGREHRTDQSLIRYFETADTLIIKGGNGGELMGMMESLAYLDAHPDKLVVIDGECASACTLLLSRPDNVVFTERASFLFHSAYIGRCQNGLFHYDMQQNGNDRMMETFPEEFRQWLIANDAFGSVDFKRLSARGAAYYFPGMMIKSKKLPDVVDTTDIQINKRPMRLEASLRSCAT